MACTLFVGNLPWRCTSDDLLALFEPHGQVRHAQIMTDLESGKSRGFGFVEMELDSAAQAAIEGMHGREFQGRVLTVGRARSSRGIPGENQS